MTHPIPANAERIPLDQIFKPKLGPSRFAPSVRAFRANYQCPGCNSDLGDLPVSKPTVCECGLSLQHDVSAVAIWREEPEAVS